jgi:hypothetical protein
MASRPGPVIAAWLVVAALGGAAVGCATDPPPPLPVRPIDKNVVVAWTIEDGLYDNGLARATEIVTVRYEGEGGLTEIQDYGRIYRGDQRTRVPKIFRRRLTATQMDELQHTMTALELPDVNRRQEKPGLVPWTMWGLCVPVTRGTQCGQLLLDEWRDIGGAPQLFTLLQSFRRDAHLHPEK